MKNCEMTQEQIEARKQYFKEWRKNNKDKVRESNKRFWDKKAREAAQKAGGTK